ncbi:MAG: 4-alpha-glucanotransferase [Parachlamydiaceae bacterium]
MADVLLIQRLTASPAGTQWQKIGISSHHGIALPLFSLHSRHSCGIGEFPDLIPLIDWCHSLGFDLIQLLPLNDSEPDTSPYCALSAYALNPLLIGISSLPHAQEDKVLQQQITDLQLLTNKTQRINYPHVQEKKGAFFREYYRLHGGTITAQEEYRKFKEKNCFWLNDYALFKALKIRFQWQPWETWPSPFRDPAPSFYISPPQELATEADFHIFLQYLCFSQFAAVKKHSENTGVFIKGDIPILINRESADVWCHRNLFILDLAAGAPPDMYAKEGQKWGFPLYNWEAIASQGYRWWIERLAVATQLYHLYRIDHIVGFFRIWGIPLSLSAKEGHFVPEDQNTWIHHGEVIMRAMLANSSMLPIGEDLGTVPPEVRNCLKNLGICGTKVMRWERRWNEDGGFIDPRDYPPESMTTVSTHDSETVELWWKNQPEEAKQYADSQGWTYTPQLSQRQRFAILRASNQSSSLFHINLLQEYLALIPHMVWPDPVDERINIPGLISDINWSYRFRPSIEEITSSNTLRQIVSLCVSAAPVK